MEFRFNDDDDLYISKDNQILLWMDSEQLSFLVNENNVFSTYHFVDNEGLSLKDFFLDTDLQCVINFTKNNDPRSMVVHITSQVVLSSLGHTFLGENDTFLNGFMQLCHSVDESRIIVNHHPELTIKVSNGKDKIKRFVLTQFQLKKRI